MPLSFYLCLFSMPFVVVVLAHRVSFPQHALSLVEQTSNVPELCDDCRDLFNNLVAACESPSSQKISEVFDKTGWRSCKEAISDLWFDTSTFSEAKSIWTFENFIEHGHDHQVMIPAYWTGFSVRKGTRAVMNEMLPELPGCHGEDFVCSDLEHPSSRLGQIMRTGSWYRQCHSSNAGNEDKQLWIRLSEVFAFVRMYDQLRLARWEKHIGQFRAEQNDIRENKAVALGHKYAALHAARSTLVPILVNKEKQELANSFLVKYELPILASSTSMPKLHFFNFKTGCNKDFTKLLPDILQGAECTSLVESTGMASVNKAPEKLQYLASKLRCFEAYSQRDCEEYSEDFWWKAIDDDKAELVNYLAQTFPKLPYAKRSKGGTSLHFAAANGKLEVIQYLAQSYSQLVEMKDQWGKTCLHSAAYEGQLAVVKFLAQSYPQLIEMKDKYGYTCLHRAALHGQLAVVKFLAQSYPQLIEMKTNGGQTCLHQAALHGQLAVVKFLAQSYPQLAVVKFLSQSYPQLIEMKDKYGETCLHWAAEKGHLAMVKFLAQSFPQLIEMKTNGGDTARDQAEYWSHKDVADFLRQKGATSGRRRSWWR
eukprot:TRINITY_DN226_c0_g1_i12.p1 TRINITY_DN226_c0_g1~~TRINITY_DN226_c0_g1_i12.p1  ORF type:complete len:594 (-),score=69.06 TRINITY_DN226_c0_g1_i12:110-1891(-)